MDYFFQKEYMIPLIGMWRYATSTEVEIRNPWYDNDILDFLIELPVEYRKGKKLFKKTVRNLFSDLFRTEVARKVSKPESRDWQKWISRNSQVLVSQMVDGNSAVDNLFDQVRINNLVKVNNSQEASIKVKLNRIKNVFKVGKSGNSWVANESPYFIYHIMEKLNKTLINIRSLITKRPPFGSPNLRLSKHRAIWNTIRLRQGLLCASSRSTSVKNQNKN